MRNRASGKWASILACGLWAMAGCSSSAGTSDASVAVQDTATADVGGDLGQTDVPAAADATATDSANPVDGTADTIAPQPGALVLNEIGAKGAPIGDWNPTSSDWMELYNGTDAEIDLKGYVTVDKTTFDLAGQLPPGTKIAAKGYLVVWFNHSGIGTPNINKGISIPGSASLFYPSGKKLDTTSFVSKSAPAGGSWARATDGGLPWKTFMAATPGKSNNP